MKVLLVGEYSRLHNSLKEGIEDLGVEVYLVGMQDSFKNFSTDFNYDAKTTIKPIFKLPNKLFRLFFKKDLLVLERGIRFYLALPKFKNYDVVQLINQTPIQTFAWLEKRILKKLISQNKKVYLLSCGSDYISVSYAEQGKFRYSVFDVMKSGPTTQKYFKHTLRYLTPEMKNISEFLYENINGVIASDFDYVLPLQNHPKFLGLVPNPINLDKIQSEKLIIQDKIVVFLGINTNARLKKGIPYFEKALQIIKEKFSSSVEIIITEDLPYAEYINSYNKCHILLDQIYAYDQGYNALEAMAKGKVVFTGAETEFLKHYGLKEDEVAINSLPDVEYLVEKLSYLIQNPHRILEISEAAKLFVQKQHNHKRIAQKYIQIWEEN